MEEGTAHQTRHKLTLSVEPERAGNVAKMSHIWLIIELPHVALDVITFEPHVVLPKDMQHSKAMRLEFFIPFFTEDYLILKGRMYIERILNGLA